MTKTSRDNNLNYINLLKHFYEYYTEKLKYRDVKYLILKFCQDEFATTVFVSTFSHL
jgi:hypothetical protein